MRQCTKLHLFHSRWSKLLFLVKIVVILSVAQLLTISILYSAWDKSHVKWDTFQNWTQKMRSTISKKRDSFSGEKMGCLVASRISHTERIFERGPHNNSLLPHYIFMLEQRCYFAVVQLENYNLICVGLLKIWMPLIPSDSSLQLKNKVIILPSIVLRLWHISCSV